MDKVHKGTTGQIQEVLIKEQADLAQKLDQKQGELLDGRGGISPMGFRPDGKTLHPWCNGRSISTRGGPSPCRSNGWKWKLRWPGSRTP